MAKVNYEYEGTFKDIEGNIGTVSIQIDAAKNNKYITDNYINIEWNKTVLQGYLAFYKRDNGSDAIIFKPDGDGNLSEIGEVTFIGNKSIEIILYDKNIEIEANKK